MHRRTATVAALTIATVATGVLLVRDGALHPSRARWQPVEVPTDADFTGLWFTDPLNGWVTGGGWAVEGGLAGRTRDGGATWRFAGGILPRGARGNGLACVQFTDTLRGRVAAPYGQILATVDGGASWHATEGTGVDGGMLNDIQFLDARNGWAAGTRILRSEDGGETWATLVRSSAGNGYLTANAIHMMDLSRGWIVGPGGTLMRTDNGGRDWVPVPLPLGGDERPTFRDVTFSDPDHGWVAGEGGAIFHTKDGGATWERQVNGVPIVRAIPANEPKRPREIVPELETEPDRLSVNAIRFADARFGWAVGSYADVAESVVLHTADGGTSWHIEHVQQGEMLRSLFVLDRQHAWAAGDRARTQAQVILRYRPAGR